MPEPHALFIVGSPRSGTKLLRELLNNHPDISLAHEGHYLSVLTDRVGLSADLADPAVWRELYRAFRGTAFYFFWAERGSSLSEDAFTAALQARQGRSQGPLTWADIFEVILRAYAPRPDAAIYGDKSHGYIHHVPLLRTLFPGVRFIQIVRDPRDQALSVQHLWGRHPLRAAHAWLSVARRAEAFGFGTAADTHTVRYEDLTADPKAVLQGVCAFLGLPETAEMVNLRAPAEDEGDGRVMAQVTKQQAKYRREMPPELIRRISEITLPYLARYGYPVEGAAQHRPLSQARLRLLAYTDGLASLRHHVRKQGVVKGTRYYLGRRLEAVRARGRREPLP